MDRSGSWICGGQRPRLRRLVLAQRDEPGFGGYREVLMVETLNPLLTPPSLVVA